MSDFNEFDKENTSSPVEEVVSNDTVTGVETVTKKKKGPIIAAVTAGVVVVAAGGSAIAYNTSDFIKNKVKLATLSPSEYYSWVNEENTATMAKTYSEAYGELLSYIGGNSEASASESLEMKYTASDDVKSLLLSSLFGADYEEYAEMYDAQSYIDMINNIDSIALNVDSSLQSGIINETISASLNDEKLLSFDFASEMNALTYFMRIPEMSEQYIGFDGGSLIDESLSSSDSEVYDKVMGFLEDPESFLSPSELEGLITKYSNVWFSTVDDVELEKKEEIEIGDITTEYTVLTIDVDGKLVTDLAENYLKEISKDDVIKNLITEKIGACTEDEFDTLIDEALTAVKETDDIDDVISGEIVTYVDAKGTIRGYTYDITSDGENIFFEYIIGKEDGKVCGTLDADFNGECNINATLNADEGDKDVYSGEIDCVIETTGYSYEDDEDTTESYDFAVEFDKFEIVNEENGYMNGEFTVVIPDVEPFSFNLSSDGKSQTLNFDLNINDVNYGSFEFTFSADKSGEATLPSTDDAFMIDPESDVSLADYVSEEQFTTFVKSVCEKIGFNSTDADALASELTYSMYSSSDYDDYYEYDDYSDYDDIYYYD